MHFSPVLNDMFTISATGYLPLWRAQTKGEVVWLDNFLQQWPSEHESLFVFLARTLQAKVSVSYCLGHQWTVNCLNLHNALRVTTSTRKIQVHQVQKFFGWWNWTRSNLCREITITCNCLRQEIFSSHPRRSIAWGRPVCQKVSKGLHGLFCRKVCRPFYHPDPVPCIKKSNKPIVTATFGVFATMNQDDLICWKVSAGMSKSSLFLGCVWQFSEAPYFQHVNLMQTLKPPFLDNVIDLRPVSNVSVPPAIKNNAHTSHRDVRPDTTLHCHWMHRKVNALNPTRA